MAERGESLLVSYREAHAGGMFEFRGGVSGSIPEAGNFSGIETEIYSDNIRLYWLVMTIIEKFYKVGAPGCPQIGLDLTLLSTP